MSRAYYQDNYTSTIISNFQEGLDVVYFSFFNSTYSKNRNKCKIFSDVHFVFSQVCLLSFFIIIQF